MFVPFELRYGNLSFVEDCRRSVTAPGTAFNPPKRSAQFFRGIGSVAGSLI
jgi:hypothetical protein